MSDSGRLRFLPRGHALGWTPYAWLAYLPLFFVQPALEHASTLRWAAHVVAAAVLIASYFRAHWVSGRELRAHVVLQGALGAAFSPINLGAYVFFTFAATAAARIERVRGAVAWILGVATVAVLVAYVNETPRSYWIGYGAFILLMGGVCLHRAQTDRANERLRAANEEIERLAAIAERERIARDLHDVLGHTLTLIVLKSELALRLGERDPARAMQEIRDVEQVSRQALKEVREALRGYRARFDDELARARRLLDTASISVVVECSIESTELAGSAMEETLALALREAATNVARHSHARRATIRVSHDGGAGSIRLEVGDDGVGDGADWSAEGNGLRGMRERVEALRGTVAVNVTHTGTSLLVDLPAPTQTGAVSLKVLRA
ncbi:MAG TPA: histidine kinase [Gemmatimonadaceae bacterium]|jgi:two-component system sensor histidine kinase DesK